MGVADSGNGKLTWKVFGLGYVILTHGLWSVLFGVLMSLHVQT